MLPFQTNEMSSESESLNHSRILEHRLGRSIERPRPVTHGRKVPSERKWPQTGGNVSSWCPAAFPQGLYRSTDGQW